MTDTILCHTEDQILIIRINRPEVMNALDPATHLAMSDALDAFEEDDHLRVAIITGAGKKAFCAGGDISVMSEAKTDADYAVPESGYGGMTRRRCKKPVIAAVNGFAFGGGFEIVLACHLAIAAEDAMPVNFNQILFTGTMEECKLRMDPPGLEGSIEKKNQIKVAS